MKIRSLLWAGIAASTLVACASTRPPELNAFNRLFLTTKPPCTEASCPLSVTVTESGGICSATIDNSLLDLSQGVPSKTISWTISSNYQFSTENYKYAIVIKTDPKGRFKNAHVQAGGQRLVLDYTRNTSGNAYTYGLNFQRNDGSFCEMLDPFMVD